MKTIEISAKDNVITAYKNADAPKIDAPKNNVAKIVDKSLKKIYCLLIT